VKAGETLAVVEAMKMENVLRAERDGVVKAIKVKPGESLAVDAVIMEFAYLGRARHQGGRALDRAPRADRAEHGRDHEQQGTAGRLALRAVAFVLIEPARCCTSHTGRT